MTIQEAQKQIDICENNIKNTYDSLKSDAISVGTSAVSSAESNTRKRTAYPLLISLLGIFIVSASPFLGVVCFIAGCYIAYKSHETAKKAQRSITDSNRVLISTVNSNNNI